MLIFLKICLTLLNFCDYITTHIGLKLGAKEGNPIVRWLMKYPKLDFIVKNIFVTICVWIIPFKLTLILLIIVYIYICINNLVVIWRQKRKIKILKNLAKSLL